MCSLHPRLFFLNSLVVNHQISHNSLEPFCSDSPTATHTTHAVSGLTATEECGHIPATQTDSYHYFGFILPMRQKHEGKKSVNCWCTRDLSQSPSASKVYELHPNSLIPPNITHHTSMWSWWMTLSSLGYNRRPTSCPSLSSLSWAWSVTVDRNSRRRWSVSLLHAGSR